MAQANIYAGLPEIVELHEIYDAGEGGAASCPHCGAQGRYIYYFTCADGTDRGAMAGCYKRFPKHEFLAILQELLNKEKAHARKGWQMAGWDTMVMEAIRSFASRQVSEEYVREVIRQSKAAKAAWKKRRGYR